MSKTAVVVIPTFNEAETIGQVIRDFCDRVFPTTNWNCSILVVDARSPDGTAAIVEAEAKTRPNVHLLVEEKKEGLGAAYFKGFRYAQDQLGADAVVEFDGDLQHPTDTVPLLLQALDDGADLALGSRRVKGGGYPKGWDPFRLFLSRFGGWVSRLLLFFPLKAFFQVTDPTTGLKATRVDDRFRALHFEHFQSKDFGYKLEMLFRLIQGGARVSEVPLLFQTRTAGESKMSGQAPWDVFRTCFVLRLRHKGTRRFIKFGLVGFSGYLVNALLLELFSHLQPVHDLAALFLPWAHLGPLVLLSKPAAWAAALAVEGSIVNNFLWNNFWTFRLTKARGVFSLLRKFLGFNMTSLGAMAIQFITIGLATAFLGNTTWVRQVTLILSIGFLVLPYNWLVYNRVIWKKKHRA